MNSQDAHEVDKDTIIASSSDSESENLRRSKKSKKHRT